IHPNGETHVGLIVLNDNLIFDALEHVVQLYCWPLAHAPCFARRLRMLPIISAMRCSFCRTLAASCSGGRCVMSSFARAFFRSRFTPRNEPSVLYSSSSAAEIFHAR